MILSFSVRVLAGAIILALLSVVTLQPQTRVAELNEAGWKAIGRGDGARAAAYFAEALTVRPDDPPLTKPEEAVTADKRRNLSRMARQFLAEKGLHEAKCRFDVLAIESEHGRWPTVRLHKAAF